MNNSKVALDNVEQQEDSRLSSLQKQKGELALLIETISRLETNEDWQRFKSLVLDGYVQRYERELAAEVLRIPLDTAKIYRLQGIIEWSKKYANPQILLSQKKKELEGINKHIYESNPRD